MSIKKSDKTFVEITRQRRKTSSRLNTYNIFRITESNQYFLNIFRAFEVTDYVKMNNEYWDIYYALEDEWWDNISFKQYGTSFYWYILCQLNDIVNPYEELVPGQQVKCLKLSYMYEVFKELANISEL